jgi:hypothetical protein
VFGEASVTFFVLAENAAPPSPDLLSPLDGSDIFGDDAILIWSAVEDPEGAPVTYVVELCRGNDCQISEPQAEVSISVIDVMEAGATYSWRVEAFDPEQNSSGPSASREFSVFGTANEASEPAAGCGCGFDSTRPRNEPVTLFFWLMLVALWRQRVRRV